MVKVKKEEKAPQPFIAKPIRQRLIIRPPSSYSKLMYALAARFPDMEHRLKLADNYIEPHEYIGRAVSLSLMNSVIFSVAIVLFLFVINGMLFEPAHLLALLMIPIMFLLFFMMWLAQPSVRASRRARDVDRDLVFAGRHLVIALKSGVPLFDAMVGVTQDYGEVSREFNKIVEKITLGESMTNAMRDVANLNPSKYFNRVVLQMVNAIVSGSDAASALDSVLDQVSQEQLIQMKEYGQKLNPFSMFFMLFGIVFPSLGVVFFTIILSFSGGVGAGLGSILLPVVFIALVGIQISFLSAMESSRPRVMLV